MGNETTLTSSLIGNVRKEKKKKTYKRDQNLDPYIEISLANENPNNHINIAVFC